MTLKQIMKKIEDANGNNEMFGVGLMYEISIEIDGLSACYGKSFSSYKAIKKAIDVEYVKGYAKSVLECEFSSREDKGVFDGEFKYLSFFGKEESSKVTLYFSSRRI